MQPASVAHNTPLWPAGHLPLKGGDWIVPSGFANRQR
jgi:cobaltochelatase CobN